MYDAHHVWKIRRKRWPQIYKLLQERGMSHDQFLERIAAHYSWTVPQAYMATEFMFRPENYN